MLMSSTDIQPSFLRDIDDNSRTNLQLISGDNTALDVCFYLQLQSSMQIDLGDS
jgi:hypothetical protein